MCAMTLSIQIAKFKSCQYQLRAIGLPNLMLAKVTCYTVLHVYLVLKLTSVGISLSFLGLGRGNVYTWRGNDTDYLCCLSTRSVIVFRWIPSYDDSRVCRLHIIIYG